MLSADPNELHGPSPVIDININELYFPGFARVAAMQSAFLFILRSLIDENLSRTLTLAKNRRIPFRISSISLSFSFTFLPGTLNDYLVFLSLLRSYLASRHAALLISPVYFSFTLALISNRWSTHKIILLLGEFTFLILKDKHKGEEAEIY